MSVLSERPFFIVGHARSGTTLLRMILSSHPRLVIPPETGFLPFLRITPEAPLSREQVRKTIRTIGALNREWRHLVPDFDRFYTELPQPTPLPQLLDALYRRRGDAPIRRWGDKTPGYVTYVPQIDAIFPNAQFIHVIRDGRDSTVSAWKKWGERRPYMDHYYLLAEWARDVEAGREAGQALGAERYLEVCYEELVQQPEPTIRQIIAFLNESFHPAVLDHTSLARKVVGAHSHREVWEPIFTTSVGRWRREMTPFQKKLANRVAGATLSAAGYELARTAPWSAAEQVRFALLAGRYHLVALIRRLLYRSGLLTLNRGKR
ncbi:MAG: sulfotransferase [Candidatus Promineifilaceae bacterium]|nr:sulfotransferase [Candidatus Promineifilaceae bacterium]